MILQEDTKGLKEIVEQNVWGSIKDFLNLGFHFGEGDKSVHITIGLLLLLIFAFMATGLVLKSLRKLFTRKMVEEDKLKFISIFKFIRYVVYLVVILLTMSSAGIDVTVILTASAAFFVGLGLALQELFQDVIAGLYIIVDKSLNVGDIIEIEGKVGRVFEIKLRTTRAITRDDKVVIIPNHKFISDTIYNYTQNHKTTREKISLCVAYGSDLDQVTEVLEGVATNQKEVLKNPKPLVTFDDFGDSALHFSLHFYLDDSFLDPKIKSTMRYAIYRKFNEEGIVIPFPQRDIHIHGAMPKS